LFIKNHSSIFSVKRMCHVMRVARSCYYEWLNRPLSKQQEEDLVLGEEIKKSFKESRCTYGHRRIKKELRGKGFKTSNDRVRRLMKELNLVPVQARKFKATTNSKHSLPVAPNLLKKNFKADEPCQKYVGDITYIHTDDGWLYLAAVIDLFSRKVVGWALGERMTKQLVINAMNQAINHEKPAEGLIFHSDRGSQYASYDYQGLLRKHGYRQSMSAKGDCYDNACAESFFATIKKECIRLERFKTRSEARLKIVDYIVWYNAKRRHSYLGNISPLEFEKQYYQNILGEAA